MMVTRAMIPASWPKPKVMPESSPARRELATDGRTALVKANMVSTAMAAAVTAIITGRAALPGALHHRLAQQPMARRAKKAIQPFRGPAASA
jgi:hypothetical protein